MQSACHLPSDEREVTRRALRLQAYVVNIHYNCNDFHYKSCIPLTRLRKRPRWPARKLPSQDTTGIDPTDVTLEAQLNPVKILPQTNGWSEERSVSKHF